MESEKIGGQVSCDLDDLGGFGKYRYKADYTEVKRIYLQIFSEAVKRTFIAMAEQLQQIREVLDGLTRSQEQNQWARNVKGPEVFKADTRESELKQWEDWKFTLENWVKAVDPEMYLDMKRVAQNAEEAIDWNKLSDARKVKSLRLFGVLASYQRGRAQAHQAHAGRERLRSMEAAAERHAAEHKAEGIGFDDPAVEDHLRPEQVHHGAAPGLRSPGQGVREGLVRSTLRT